MAWIAGRADRGAIPEIASRPCRAIVNRRTPRRAREIRCGPEIFQRQEDNPALLDRFARVAKQSSALTWRQPGETGTRLRPNLPATTIQIYGSSHRAWLTILAKTNPCHNHAPA